MKKLTKAMAISLLASTVAISTVGCRYTVEVKDNEAPTKQEQQLQPTADEKSDSTTNNSKEAEKSATSEKTNKKDEKSSSQATAKGESKKDVKVYTKEKEKDYRHICAICGKKLPYDDAIYFSKGWAHGDCLNRYYKETGEGDWDDSPAEDTTNNYETGNGDTSHDEPDTTSSGNEYIQDERTPSPESYDLSDSAE